MILKEGQDLPHCHVNFKEFLPDNHDRKPVILSLNSFKLTAHFNGLFDIKLLTALKIRPKIPLLKNISELVH